MSEYIIKPSSKMGFCLDW